MCSVKISWPGIIIELLPNIQRIAWLFPLSNSVPQYFKISILVSLVLNFHQILCTMAEGRAHISLLPLHTERLILFCELLCGQSRRETAELWKWKYFTFWLGGCSWLRATSEGKNKRSSCVFLLSIDVNLVLNISSIYKTFLLAVKRSL